MGEDPDERTPYIPPHKASAHITHNQHLAYYESIADYANEGNWVSQESKAKAIQMNEVWELQWYPETPIGSHRIMAATWSDLVRYLKANRQDER